jgi:hypothetical protein
MDLLHTENDNFEQLRYIFSYNKTCNKETMHISPRNWKLIQQVDLTLPIKLHCTLYIVPYFIILLCLTLDIFFLSNMPDDLCLMSSLPFLLSPIKDDFTCQGERAGRAQIHGL